MSWLLVAACGVALVAGIAGGQLLVGRVSEGAARRGLLLLALGGSVTAIGKGVVALW